MGTTTSPGGGTSSGGGTNPGGGTGTGGGAFTGSAAGAPGAAHAAARTLNFRLSPARGDLTGVAAGSLTAWEANPERFDAKIFFSGGQDGETARPMPSDCLLMLQGPQLGTNGLREGLQRRALAFQRGSNRAKVQVRGPYRTENRPSVGAQGVLNHTRQTGCHPAGRRQAAQMAAPFARAVADSRVRPAGFSSTHRVVEDPNHKG